MKNNTEKIIKILEEKVNYHENIIENNTEPLDKARKLLNYHLGSLDTLRDIIRLLKENQKVKTDEYGNWTCICGNIAEDSGFFPCDEKGELVEPTPELWKTPLYKCESCSRIINQDTLEYVEKK